jgi:hypothetical protein
MRRRQQQQQQQQQQEPLEPNSQQQEPNPNQNENAAGSAAPFAETEAPHDGPVNQAPPEPPEGADTAAVEVPAVKRRRRRKNVVTEPEVEEITKDDVEDMQFAIDMLIYQPSIIYLHFETPEDKHQLRMARIAARLHNKYFGKNCSDEFKFFELLTFWILVNCWRKFGGKDGQRNNGGVRSETPRKNPLDDPIRQRTD